MFDEDLTFAEWSAMYNKSYRNKAEYDTRKKAWKKARRQYKKMNQANSLATFNTNFTADQTNEELLGMLGLDDTINQLESKLSSLTNRCTTDETVLCSGEYEIDWVTEGKVHAVKDQGYCGSCWSFAAVLALESKVAIENDTDVVRLSE